MNKAKAIESVVRTSYPSSHARWLKQQHVKDVSTYLGEDEWPEAVLFGKPNMGTWGGLWATDKRLLWIYRALWGLTLDVKDYTYQKINSIGFSPLGGVITITFSGQLLSFALFEVDKKVAPRFIEHVRTKMSDMSTLAGRQAVIQSKEPDLVTQLERLSQLKSQGAISEEEFETAKRKLLG